MASITHKLDGIPDLDQMPEMPGGVADAAAVTATSVPAPAWRTLASPPKAEKLPKGLDAAWDACVAFVVPLIPRTGRLMRRAQRIVAMDQRVARLADDQLRSQAMAMRERFRLGRETRADVDTALALIREASRRVLGLHHHPVQVAAALGLVRGWLVELATGEGKTLAATMPAILAGWRGRGCHVITVNDYLAKRDADEMRPLYAFCGLTVAHVDGSMDPRRRRAAYRADITYATNKEVAADFLRDQLALGTRRGLTDSLLAKYNGGGGGHAASPDSLVMRGLATAIVDEVDSILIDEAVTPLIISGDVPDADDRIEAYEQALQLADQLQQGRHYRVNHRYREVELTPRGRRALAQLAAPLGGVWAAARRREELVAQALTARVMYLRGKQYIVQDGKIVIIDEFTGRLMPDRTWRNGMHQLMEAKERLDVNPPKETLARLSFQRFFRLYHRLSGMTATAWEVRRELWQVYKLKTVRVPTHRPCIRRHAADRVFGTADAKWHAVVAEVQRVHRQGRPVLVGTRSVQASEHLSALLTAQGLTHEVLNAERHAEEARIVAEAGQPGRITVATNMAGRGTDIKLGPGVADRGGLHVIATERHESRRIDRQLFGRCARQGDPGSVAVLLSVQDELIHRYGSAAVRRAAATLAGNHRQLARPLASPVISRAQARAERIAKAQRKAVLKTDDWLDQALGFAVPEA